MVEDKVKVVGGDEIVHGLDQEIKKSELERQGNEEPEKTFKEGCLGLK